MNLAEQESKEVRQIDFDTLPEEELIPTGKWQQITGESPQATHFFVVVPAHNEAAVIERSVANLARQTRPKGSEMTIMAAVNGSTDDTSEIVQKMQPRYNQPGLKLMLVQLPEANKARALNTARALSKNNLIIHVDADTLPTPLTTAKLYALMHYDSDIKAAAAMPRRIPDRKSTHLGNMQDFYDEMTKTNGAIIGKTLIYRPEYFPPFPEDTGSEDTWMEYFALIKYGRGSVKFLGQTQSSDVAAMYHGTSTYPEYLAQILRWENQYRQLMTNKPELKKAQKLADRAKQPHGLWETFCYLRDNYKLLPLADKIIFYNLLLGVRRWVKDHPEPSDGSWHSPRTDRRERL